MRISDWSSDVCSSDLIGARHVDVRGVGAGVDPDAIGRPAEAGAFGLPPLHRDHAVIEVAPAVADEPASDPAPSPPMSDNQRPPTDEASPTGHKPRAIHRAPRRGPPLETPPRPPL